MEEEIPVEGIDTALILENKLRERVRAVARQLIVAEVSEQIRNVFTKQKEEMMLEIAMKLGEMLHGIEKEGRVPLWRKSSFDDVFDGVKFKE